MVIGTLGQEWVFHLFSKFDRLFLGGKSAAAVRFFFRLIRLKLSFRSWISKTSQGLAPDEFGYDSELIGNVVIKKNQRYRIQMLNPNFMYPQSLVRPLIPLAYITQKHVRVLDFGGGGGAQYFATSNLLSPSRVFDWRVIETAAIVNQSSNLANDQLEFYKSIGEAISDGFSPNLVMASSSLEYTKNPMETLRELINLDADFLYLTRSALTLEPDLITAEQSTRLKDNGPGPLPDEFKDCDVNYWIRILPMSLVREELSKKYELLFTSLEAEKVLRIRDLTVNQYGILARRKKSV